ncbi:AzlD domain-containing protein [Alicyclobacillus fastidiosus]|uniref:AzlD domain-containing protein n=1 Tax=Alicyclobacillus fastidiosus TaxID=392011 RepID=A0ABV5A8S2_9BACL|nr:AzlD domain-containing protein [Alicyclobacillus fastidiosus]WEH10649.1 AzlD domain-containing protein [Alicyclobacillus fastidiosus]
MVIFSTLWLQTVIIGLGTYFIRSGSLIGAGRINWSTWFKNWLSFVTPAVLGALLGPLLLLPNSHWEPLFQNTTLWSAIPTALVAWFTRNLILTVASGVVCFAIATHFF